ncbi:MULTISPECIES: sensor histidine kinase [Cyanophyceae]|jgi:signal transduction histidine kinase|uniref:histidine kinase n=1 Tax=Aphanothece cf. minutissima CCALA 015 TaxID=2107695 RepID=A0ABX5F8B0_9CHRO|nr:MULTISPECIES: HAMP domain-containing sensor histidine kinase [Cyanophyceae]MCP9797642.1 HAMP domain-containing histidine kinase [Cyanobium sp. Lug-B]PSB37909.1 histidine kinase [Aphanothece cf. minutissima CCALA 015]
MAPPTGAPPRGWRHRLFGSLLGQLRLAAFTSVFLGFSAASAFTLLINRDCLLHHQHHGQRLGAGSLADALDRLVADPSVAHADLLRVELERRSDRERFFWVQHEDGSLLLPGQGTGELLALPGVVGQAMAAHSGAWSVRSFAPLLIGTDRRLVKDPEGNSFLTYTLHRSSGGSQLWVAEDISNNVASLRSMLLGLAVVWILSLVLTLVAISVLTRRLLQPLRDLHRMAAGVTSESLASSHLKLEQAPLEVEELAQSFNGLLDRLALAWSQQRHFVGLVSHELRNPLMIIGGYLRRLQRRGQNLDPEQMRALATTEAETHRITRMLNDLLDLSRSESGQLQMVLAPVAVDEVLTTACDLARSQLSRPLLLTLPEEAAEGPVRAVAETDRLQQVLLNLIENADKYSAPGRPISLELTRNDAELCITVRDQGIGIPPEDIPKVFDRFHRGRNAIEHERGSGLGLSVVKLLVEAMGGSIDVDSEIGVGSRFHIHLPAAP